MIKEVEELTVTEVRNALHTLIEACVYAQDEDGEKEMRELSLSFDKCVKELEDNHFEYTHTSLIPSDVSFKEYIGANKEQESD